MNINVDTKKHGIGIQLFDALYAYWQSIGKNYKSDIGLTINGPAADINILFDYMPGKLDIKGYDLIFLCNGGEPLFVTNKIMQIGLKLDNVYLITNSYLTSDHQLSNKNIWFPHNIMTCRDYYTRHFYPQYFENLNNCKLKKKNAIIGINGVNRANRNYFFKELINRLPNIEILSNINSSATSIMPSIWETAEDNEFRNYLDKQSTDHNLPSSNKIDYKLDAVSIGVEKKHGTIALGYFIMPEYFTYSCIIFPESGWQNNELTITEKAIKCFYAKSLPFPIGGANINKLYNEIGFNTAWNLLPDELQSFDSVLDHSLRYKMMIDAIQWLFNNLEIFESIECIKMTEKNKETILTCSSDYISVKMLDKVIQNKINEIQK